MTKCNDDGTLIFKVLIIEFLNGNAFDEIRLKDLVQDFRGSISKVHN
jgi:hypothetical protein